MSARAGWVSCRTMGRVRRRAADTNSGPGVGHRPEGVSRGLREPDIASAALPRAGAVESDEDAWSRARRLNFVDLQIPANLYGQKIIDREVPRNRRRFLRGPVDIDRVPATLTQKNASVPLAMSNEVVPLHYAKKTNGSRMTSCPLMDSSDNARFASKTNSTASARLARASSIVAACVFAPGSSSTNAMKPSGTRRNTAVNCMAEPDRLVNTVSSITSAPIRYPPIAHLAGWAPDNSPTSAAVSSMQKARSAREQRLRGFELPVFERRREVVQVASAHPDCRALRYLAPVLQG